MTLQAYDTLSNSLANSPDNALVLSVDEKALLQALDRRRPLLPLRPVLLKCRTHDYERRAALDRQSVSDLQHHDWCHAGTDHPPTSRDRVRAAPRQTDGATPQRDFPHGILDEHK